MNIKDWTYQSSNIQGDINIHLEKGLLVGDFIELNIFAFSDKWSKTNISLEYQNSYTQEWHSNMHLITDCDFINGNNIYGISSSSYGDMHKVLWNFKKSNIQQGDNIKIRVNILPRILYSSIGNNCNILTHGHNKDKIDVKNIYNNYSVIGVNNEGDYIATNSNSIFVLNGDNIIHQWTGVSNPSCAIQIYNNNYIISDRGNNRIIELDQDLGGILQTYSVNIPVFIDYDEINLNLLVSENNNNSVFEINWDSNNGGNYLIWTYPNVLDGPTCATYAFKNKDEVVISNSNNNEVIVYNKTTQNEKSYIYCTFNDSLTNFERRININKPLEAYKINDDDILIVEKSGISLDFGSISNGIDSFLIGEDALI